MVSMKVFWSFMYSMSEVLLTHLPLQPVPAWMLHWELGSVLVAVPTAVALDLLALEDC